VQLFIVYSFLENGKNYGTLYSWANILNTFAFQDIATSICMQNLVGSFIIQRCEIETKCLSKIAT